MESIEEKKERMYQEKLNRAGQRLAYRLVFAAIILVIIFIILVREVGDASSIIQWLCLILFIGIVLIVLAVIAKRYYHEKDDAIREIQPNWRIKQRR